MNCVLLGAMVGRCIDCKNMHGLSNIKLFLESGWLHEIRTSTMKHSSLLGCAAVSQGR